MYLRHFLKGGSLGDPPVLIRDPGDDTQDRKDPLQIPQQSGPPYGVNATKLINGAAVEIPSSGSRYCSVGNRGGGDICPLPP